MAKFENELDIAVAQQSIAKQKINILQAFVDNPDLAKISKQLSDNTNVTCYIFSKSVAFRIGKSSVKSISGYSGGFKTSFGTNKDSKTVFGHYSVPSILTKENKVTLVAAYWLLMHPERVKSESDKTEAVETEQVVQTQTALKKIIKEYGQVKLKVGDAMFDVDDFAQVTGRPKADMVFKYRGNSVIFVSHKKGSKAGDFQQYGGLASDLGIRTRSDTSRFQKIESFLSKLDEVLNAVGVSKDSQKRYDFNKLKKGSNFAQLIDDENIAYTVMFGKDYHTKKMGLNNCSILIDGDIMFTPVKDMGLNVFELTGSYHHMPNPELMTTKPRFSLDNLGIYAPAVFIMKSEQQGLSQAGYANARAVIWPNNKVIESYRTKFDDAYTIIKSKDKNKIEALKKEMLK